MEIEKLPSVIDGMQRDIALLKKRMDSIKGVAEEKKAGGVRLLLRDGRLYEASDLDCLLFDLAEVDGIIIPVLDGREFLLYPKYAKRSMRKSSGTGEWKAKNMTEIESLHAKSDGSRETDELLAIDSPAAEFVRGVAAHRKFNLPGDLLAAMAVVLRCDEINAMAEHIDGADNLVKSIGIWSCSRHSDINGWYAGDYNGYGAYYCKTTCPCLAVPVVLYNS